MPLSGRRLQPTRPQSTRTRPTAASATPRSTPRASIDRHAAAAPRARAATTTAHRRPSIATMLAPEVGAVSARPGGEGSNFPGGYRAGMAGWRVGSATITPVIEVETVTSPRFLFSDVRQGRRDRPGPRRRGWRRSFVDDDGYLAAAHPVPRHRHRRHAHRRRHLRRQRQGAGQPGLAPISSCPSWPTSPPPGSRPTRSTPSICTHLHVDHVGWNTRLVDGRWVPTFPNARYVLAGPSSSTGSATAYPDDDDVFGDSVAPIARRRSGRPRRRRPSRRPTASASIPRPGTRPVTCRWSSSPAATGP